MFFWLMPMSGAAGLALEAAFDAVCGAYAALVTGREHPAFPHARELCAGEPLVG